MKKLYDLVTILIFAILSLGTTTLSAQVFVEDFSSVTDLGTQQCEAKGSVISAAHLTEWLPGWTGSKVYGANGKLKMGTGSAAGWVQTPAIDLSGNNGEYTLSFDAKAWNSATEKTTLNVIINDETIVVEGLPKVDSTDATYCEMRHYTITRTDGVAETYIKFLAASDTNARFFIDNVMITAGNDPVMQMNPSTLNFGFFILDQTDPRTINTTVTGMNLTAGGTTTVTLSEGFTTTMPTISNDAIMSADGVSLPITFTPSTGGEIEGTIVLTNADKTIEGTLMATVEAPVGLFSEFFTQVSENGSQQCNASGSKYSDVALDSILPGWTGENVYGANGKLKMGTTSTKGWVETPAIDLSGNNGHFRLSFDAKAWNSAAEMTYLKLTVNNQVVIVDNLPNVDYACSDCCTMGTFVYEFDNGTAETYIKFEAAEAGNSRFFLDNVVITDGSEPIMRITPATLNLGIVLLNEDGPVTDTLNLSAFALDAAGTTTITLPEGFTTTMPTSISNTDLMVEGGINMPITFTPTVVDTVEETVVMANEQLTATAVVSAIVLEAEEISTLAELRTKMDYSNVNSNYSDSKHYYKYTGNAVVTQKNTDEAANVWIQDATAAIQLYDPEPFLRGSDLGVGISNVIGTLTNYYGYLELQVRRSAILDPMPDLSISPMPITLMQLQDENFMDGIQAQLIRIDSVSFTQSGYFQSNMRYEMIQSGVADSGIYVITSHDPCVGQSIPVSASVIGVNARTAAYSNGYGSPRLPSRYYVLPRDFQNGVGIAENVKANVQIYPNPTNGNIHIAVDVPVTEVAIYDMFGKLVDRQSVSTGDNMINMSQVNAGVYFLRIFNGNSIVGTAKVVRN